MVDLHEKKNFCKREVMSSCTAKDKIEQEKCTFYEKATQAKRCMYNIFDEYCDCLKAQMDAKK